MLVIQKVPKVGQPLQTFENVALTCAHRFESILFKESALIYSRSKTSLLIIKDSWQVVNFTMFDAFKCR
ncbi:MAG: hypothetical protein DRQ10_02345 [Candidatus Hydrothermota bacterium]|nr:MAG: hypothetical protein DRQ10_02345 [Candidatus Hydrothermae bacterium]